MKKQKVRDSKNNIVQENNSQSGISKKILIKDVFADELFEIGKYIYIKMGNPNTKKDAIKAWDKLEDLSYQPITNKKALLKIIKLIKIHSQYSDSIIYSEKKYSKYL